MSSTADLRPLKERVRLLPDRFAIFREFVRDLPDTMELDEYRIKAGDWLRLLEIKKER